MAFFIYIEPLSPGGEVVLSIACNHCYFNLEKKTPCNYCYMIWADRSPISIFSWKSRVFAERYLCYNLLHCYRCYNKHYASNLQYSELLVNSYATIITFFLNKDFITYSSSWADCLIPQTDHGPCFPCSIPARPHERPRFPPEYAVSQCRAGRRQR